MVGLVIVSHSRKLAEAACALAKGVGQQELPIAFAGGAGDDYADFGTDATDIMDAIHRVNSGDGVVVLMDLGSAVLSARLAEQMLEDDVPKIRLCPAPLVEGAVAAAVQIGTGAGVDAVYEEAKNALAAKMNEFASGDGDEAGGAQAETPAVATESAVPTDAVVYRFTMDDPNGMHARPAAELVKATSGFESEVRIRNPLTNSPFVNARSLNQIALSNIRRGDISELAIWGPQAKETLEAVKKLVIGVYHGREAAEVPIRPISVRIAKPAPEDVSGKLTTLSPGVAVASLVMEGDGDTLLPAQKVSDPEEEVRRLDGAVTTVHSLLEGQKKNYGPDLQKEAAILDAQLLLLDDPEVLGEVKAAIRRDSQDAASVYQARMRGLADSYRSLPDAYMRERAADIGGVAGQVLDVLTGKKRDDTQGAGDVVIWAAEVTPAQVGRWPRERLKGILTREGGLTSHVAILAKAMGIPAVMGYTPPSGSASGDAIALDANSREVVVKPIVEQKAEFENRRQTWLEGVARDLADAQGPAKTADGMHVPVWANVGDAATVEAAVRNGAEGIGLLRTEFLFLDRRLPPDEEEQTHELTRLLTPFASLPVTVRTLDAGGDKAMPWLDLAPEANPFLGVRGVRLVMAHPDLFRTQLRAILRAGGEAAVAHLQVMIPMISTVQEVEFSRKALADAHEELRKEGAKHCWPVRFGIMIETPAAVLQAEKLAALVDFFSMGTNDLTQYVMCAERGSKELVHLFDGMHPAVLTAIGIVAEGAGRHGTEVAVCGEMAGDPIAATALAGLGVHHLSMNAAAIGRVKRAIRANTSSSLAEAAHKALAMTSAEEVRALFAGFAPK